MTQQNCTLIHLVALFLFLLGDGVILTLFLLFYYFYKNKTCLLSPSPQEFGTWTWDPGLTLPCTIPSLARLVIASLSGRGRLSEVRAKQQVGASHHQARPEPPVICLGIGGQNRDAARV